MKCISKYDFIFIFFILVIINLIFYKICRPSFCSSFYLFIYFIFFGALFSYQPEKVGDILEEGREGGGGATSSSAKSCMHGRMATDTTTLPWWWLGRETSLSKEQMSSGVSIKVVGNWIEKETDDVFYGGSYTKRRGKGTEKKEILGAKTKHKGEGFSIGFFWKKNV